MDEVEVVEPLRLEVLGFQACGRPAVGDERALAARRHEHADPARAVPRDPNRSDVDVVSSELGDERAAHTAAEPPSRISTRPGTSVPLSIGVDAFRTTSSTRSPRTSTRGGVARTGLIRAAVTTPMVAMPPFAQGREAGALV